MPAAGGIKNICVFCGSSIGNSHEYRDGAVALAHTFAEAGIGLVYGGGGTGLMGEIATELLALGGSAIGVIPQSLVDRELAHQGLTRLEVVVTMHERKARMAELSDAFIAMPGGFGTLEEVFEAITWTQLGIHHKPLGLFNVAGFYNQLISFVQFQSDAGFIRESHVDLMNHDADASSLIAKLAEQAENSEIEPKGKARK